YFLKRAVEIALHLVANGIKLQPDGGKFSLGARESAKPSSENSRTGGFEKVAAVHGLARFREKFGANILQDVSGALDTDFAREHRIFIFDAENALVADIHIGADDFLPQLRAVAVTDGAEVRGGFGQILRVEREIQHAVSLDVVLVEDRVFHMRVEDGVLFSE